MLKLPIYLDYSATTPVDPRVAAKMIPYLTEHFGNPASRSHPFGWEAEKAVEAAREQVAALVNADPKEIIWTSGATESNNLAIKGAAHFYKGKGKHIVTVKTEHKAVLDTCRELERQGFEVTYLAPESNGLLDFDKFKAAVRPDTIIASVMFVNNEIGVIQDIEKIGEFCREKGVIFHVDSAQAAGKVPIDLAKLKVDLMSFSAHKIYGPKGIGALYVRRKPRIRLEAQMHGGGHERGLRSGTENVAAIVGFGTACEIALQRLDSEPQRLRALRDELEQGLVEQGARIFGSAVQRSGPGMIPRLPNTVYFSIPGIDGETLVGKLDRVGFAVASGAACSSANPEPSHVLLAMGVDGETARGAVRVSLGAASTQQQVKDFLVALGEMVVQLKGLTALVT